PLEIIKRPQLRVYGVVSAFRRSDGVGAAWIIRSCAKRIVLAFSILCSNGMNRREVQNIEAHRPDGRQAMDNIQERAVHSWRGAAGSGKKFVPTCKCSLAPLNPKRIRHRASGFKAFLAPCAYRVAMRARLDWPELRLPPVITRSNHR